MALYVDQDGNIVDDGAGDGGTYANPFHEQDSNVGEDIMSGLLGVGLGVGGTLLVEELLRDHRHGKRRGVQGGGAAGDGGIIWNPNAQQAQGGGWGGQGGIAVPNLPAGFRAISAVPFAIATHDGVPAPTEPRITVYRCLDRQGNPVTFNPSQQASAMVLKFAIIPPAGWVPGWPP